MSWAKVANMAASDILTLCADLAMETNKKMFYSLHWSFGPLEYVSLLISGVRDRISFNQNMQCTFKLKLVYEISNITVPSSSIEYRDKSNTSHPIIIF